MAFAYKRGDYWKVICKIGGRIKEVATRQKGRRPNDVVFAIVEKYRQLEGCEKQGLPWADKTTTVADLVKAYWESNPSLGEHSRRKKQGTLSQLVAEMGDKVASTINIIDCEKFLRKPFDITLKEVSRNTYRTQLASVWAWGMKRKLVAENPWKEITYKISTRSPRRPLTPDEQDKILLTAKGNELLAIALGLFQGARIGDCINLCFEHVNLTNKTITFINRKGGTDDNKRPQVMPLHPFLLQMFSQLPRYGNAFTMHPNDLGFRVKRAFIKAGILGVTHHFCRHTFISDRINAGCSQAQVAELAGHSTWNITRRYTHQNVEALRGVLELRTGAIAQRLEQGTHNPLVDGSSPSGPISHISRANP